MPKMHFIKAIRLQEAAASTWKIVNELAVISIEKFCHTNPTFIVPLYLFTHLVTRTASIIIRAPAKIASWLKVIAGMCKPGFSPQPRPSIVEFFATLS